MKSIDKARAKSLQIWVGTPEHRAQIRALGHANLKPLSLNATVVTPNLAYIIGVLMGDGSLYGGSRIELGVNIGDKEFVRAFAAALRCQFSAHTTLREKIDKRNGTRLSVCLFTSKLAYEFLKRICTVKWVDSLSTEMKLLWLRGIWDSEGSIDIKATSPNVQFAITDEDVANAYCRALKLCVKVEPHIHRYFYTYKNTKRPIWHVRIFGRENVLRFYRLVQPTIRRKRRCFKRLEKKER